MKVVNFVPWRQLERIREIKLFFMCISLCACVGITTVLGYYFYLHQQISVQRLSNIKLQQNYQYLVKDKFNFLAKDDASAANLQNLQKLQQKLSFRQYQLKELDQLALSRPASIILDSVSYANDQLTIVGTAAIDSDILAFIKNLSASASFKDAKIIDRSQKLISGKKVNFFKISAGINHL